MRAQRGRVDPAPYAPALRPCSSLRRVGRRTTATHAAGRSLAGSPRAFTIPSRAPAQRASGHRGLGDVIVPRSIGFASNAAAVWSEGVSELSRSAADASRYLRSMRSAGRTSAAPRRDTQHVTPAARRTEAPNWITSGTRAVADFHFVPARRGDSAASAHDRPNRLVGRHPERAFGRVRLIWGPGGAFGNRRDHVGRGDDPTTRKR